MKKKISGIVALFLIILLLPGCSFELFSSEGLLAAPNPTGSYAKIKSALDAYVGTAQNNGEFQPKFPLTGENRSAYVLNDIDNDGIDEAIVFYRLKDSSSLPSFAYLKLIDKQWVCRKSFGGFGNEINELIIQNIDDTPESEIIISWTIPDSNEKNLTVFQVSSDGLVIRQVQFVDVLRTNLNEILQYPYSIDFNYSTPHTTSYIAALKSYQNDILTNQTRFTLMALIDIDNNGIKEIITLNTNGYAPVPDVNNTENEVKSPNMVIYSFSSLSDGSTVLPIVSYATNDGTVTSYDRISCDPEVMEKQSRNIYIDYSVESLESNDTTAKEMTQVFYWSNNAGKLIKVFADSNAAEGKKTERAKDIHTMYISRLGSFCIPQAVTGADSGDKNIVIWNKLGPGGELSAADCSYVNNTYSYHLFLPVTWIDTQNENTRCNVYTKPSQSDNITTFYCSDKETEYRLLEIFSSSKELDKADLSDDFALITAAGGRFYYAHVFNLPPEGENFFKYMITVDTVRKNFEPITENKN